MRYYRQIKVSQTTEILIKEQATGGRSTGANSRTEIWWFLLHGENIARKQEEFEEKLKFKNQFKPLDEDDVEYLVGFGGFYIYESKKVKQLMSI